MKVTLERIDGKFHMLGKNEENLTVETDAGIDTGGTNSGMRPMQLVLVALGSCSSIDVVLILDKMRQELKNIKVDIEAKRREEVPRIFTSIHVHYRLYGDIDDKKAKRAVSLSMEQYCSVGVMLKNADIDITHSYEIFPNA